MTAGQKSEVELDAVRKLHREAQWFFDFCYVENSEGAHNSSLAYRCLDTSEAKIDEAMGMLASAGMTDTGTAPAEETAAEEAPTEETPAEENPAEEVPAEETPAEEAAVEETPAAEEKPKAVPSFAGYRADAENTFSKVTVIASVQNGILKEVRIFSEGEDGKDLLTDAIREEWAKAILESGSAAPDAVTGATLKFSAASVQEAMEEILKKIAGE